MLKKQLDVDMDQEINKLVQKYNKLQLPLMEKSNELIAGDRNPLPEEIQEYKAYFTDNEIKNIE